MPERLFRCAGDIQFRDSSPDPTSTVHITLKPFSETINYVQYQQPLSPQQPTFTAKIRKLGPRSIVTVGIAGSHIGDDVHPGSWNATVGYRSTGHCYTAHRNHAVHAGHTFREGLLLLGFGYLFESDHSQYLPTVALERGPIELELNCPPSIHHVPKYHGSSALQDWILSPGVRYDKKHKIFLTDDKSSQEHLLQSPVPLSKTIQHYEAIVEEVSDTGAAPTIAIATCSPLVPSPTCVLLNDYFRWHPDGKLLTMKKGQRMGWGIQYNPTYRDSADFDDRAQQLVLCYVTIDVTIVYAKMMLQPEGGWYPVVMLHPYASQVGVDMETNAQPVINERLDELFHNLIVDAVDLVKQDQLARALDMSSFRTSTELSIVPGETVSNISLTREQKGIHVIQFLKPLTAEQRYFSVEIATMGDSSMVCIGIAGPDFPLNKYPGRLKDTIGYHSRDGKMYYNDKDNGNMRGHRYGKGDTVGIEMEVFEKEMSVALFSRNGLPVGTRYMTQQDHHQFLPTVAVSSNGSDVCVRVVWQNRVSTPPAFNVTNLEHWCLPEGAVVDLANSVVSVETGHSEAEAIQAPYSLHRTYNHFEVELIDDFDEQNPPPAIALCTASPFDPTPKTNFKQDFIRFWATGEAQKAVRKSDLMGWGMVYPDDRKHHDEEQLVICYLTINRDVALTRVMFQPPGGFYPVVLLPPGVDRIKLNFGATIITEHPFTPEAIEQLLEEARSMIKSESQLLAKGDEPEEWDSEENKAKYLKPVPKTAGNSPERHTENFTAEDLPGLKRRSTKMANLVEAMMLNSVTNSPSSEQANGKENGKTENGNSETENPENGIAKRDEEKQTSRTCAIL